MHADAHPTEELPLLAAGLLDDQREAQLRSHLSSCRVCAEELDHWQAIAVAARDGQVTSVANAAAHVANPTPPPVDGDAAPDEDAPADVRPAEQQPVDADLADQPTTLADDQMFHPLRHLAADKATRYRAILQVFADERQRFLIHLRPDDIAAALGESATPELAIELSSLVEWHNLRDVADTQRVTSVEDFHARRRLYALTPAGEAAEQAIGAYTDALGRRAELQTVALTDISTGLDALLALMAEAEEDDVRTVTRIDAERAAPILRELTGVFEALSDNAAAFMGSLVRTIDAAADRDTFLAHKDRLLAYLQRFLTELVSRAAAIAAQLGAIGELDEVARAVARREAVDANPDEDDHEQQIRRRTEVWLRRWDGLRAWFIGGPGSTAQSDLLRRRALTSIRELLAAAAALNERRTGRSDRAADYRTLARWFAESDDSECHQLWRAAFGLSASRHLTVDGDTLADRREAPVAASTSWVDAEPVAISPRLRATGFHERRGRIKAVADRTDQQAALRRLVRTERADLAALEVLPLGEPVRLSDLDLDERGFAVLLELLSDALAAGDPTGGSIEAESRDGSLRIRLAPPTNDATAQIRVPGGTLRGPDHLLTLLPTATGSPSGPGRHDHRNTNHGPDLDHEHTGHTDPTDHPAHPDQPVHRVGAGLGQDDR